jgi:hypothetical protein
VKTRHVKPRDVKRDVKREVENKRYERDVKRCENKRCERDVKRKECEKQSKCQHLSSSPLPCRRVDKSENKPRSVRKEICKETQNAFPNRSENPGFSFCEFGFISEI